MKNKKIIKFKIMFNYTPFLKQTSMQFGLQKILPALLLQNRDWLQGLKVPLLRIQSSVRVQSHTEGLHCSIRDPPIKGLEAKACS